MEKRAPAQLPAGLKAALLAYLVASLFHFTHNAQFLDDYPNMPAWLMPAHIYAVWWGETAIGALGYLLYRGHHRLAGPGLLAAYGALGFDGLGHYRLAPFSEHALVMNISIWFEAAAAVCVLVAVARQLVVQARPAAGSPLAVK
jgi:hypothetical protein